MYFVPPWCDRIVVCGCDPTRLTGQGIKYPSICLYGEKHVCVSVSVRACVSPSQAVEVVVIKLGTVTASDTSMHHNVNYIDLDLQ